jgi:Protein of unknown function (DUF1598)
MRLRRLGWQQLTANLVTASLAVAALAAIACPPQTALAQATGSQPAGVIVDAQGVLHRQTFSDPTGQLTRQRIEAARTRLNPKVATKSKLRKVSLPRMEKALAGLVDPSHPTDEMLHLAGLQRIQYVFLYPDTGDVVIAGPAEGWVDDLSGRVVGMTTGRPVLELQDLVVALRAYPPGDNTETKIGCSIDPTKEGLARYQEFYHTAKLQGITPADTSQIVEGLKTSLGPQKVRINGVPPNTHFAQVMVEADYRMKLIGIGLEQPPIRLVSWIARASGAGGNAMQRWYFVPDYKCVRVSEGDTAMELVGDGVKLVGADEVVDANGERTQAGRADGASKAFVNGFTKKYPELAQKSPVFAQLRNLIDMAIAAAFLQEQDYYGKAHWKPDGLLSETKLPVQTYNAPVQVDPAINPIIRGSTFLAPIGGGVSVRAHEALAADNLLEDEGGKVEKVHEAVSVKGLAQGQWWWD